MYSPSSSLRPRLMIMASKICMLALLSALDFLKSELSF